MRAIPAVSPRNGCVSAACSIRERIVGWRDITLCCRAHARRPVSARTSRLKRGRFAGLSRSDGLVAFLRQAAFAKSFAPMDAAWKHWRPWDAPGRGQRCAGGRRRTKGVIAMRKTLRSDMPRPGSRSRDDRRLWRQQGQRAGDGIEQSDSLLAANSAAEPASGNITPARPSNQQPGQPKPAQEAPRPRRPSRGLGCTPHRRAAPLPKASAPDQPPA